MQEETVDFKLDVSDESIKRNAMKVVWMFSGVTFVDIKEKGQVKVRGNFDKYVMGTRLQQIDKSVDIINPMQKPEQTHIPFISSISSYFIVPKIQEIVVYEFKLLSNPIKPEAMEVIWEYSGIISVEVEENHRLKVKGEGFNKLEMLTKLKKIDESVKILSFGQVQEDGTTKIKFNMLGNKQSDASSSKGPTPAPVFGAAGARARAAAAAEKEKAQTPVNKWPVDKAIEILKVPLKAGYRALYNPQPPIKQLELHIEKQKANKLRIEQEKAEKLRIEKEKVEKQRKEKEKANKLRIEKEKAEKLRIEKEKAKKLRIEQEKAEKLRIEKEKANKLRSSAYTEGNNNTQTQTQSWLTGSTSTASTYLSTLWNPSQFTESSRTTGSTQYQSSTQKPRKESRFMEREI